MDTNKFVVEDPGNSSYINSLLVALFYTPSYINTLLSKNISDISCIYLQEFIKEKYVGTIHNHKSITNEDINYLKYILYKNNWRSFKDIYDCHNVEEFYEFILKKFEGQKIEIQNRVIKTDSLDKVEKIAYIPLTVSDDMNEKIYIKDLLHNWMHHDSEVYEYDISNIPVLMCFKLNRGKCKKDVYIQKKIKLSRHLYPNNADLEWDFHSAICFSDHYYTLLNHNKEWLIFDNDCIPCIKRIRMDDKQITTHLKKESIFLIYKLNI